MSPTNCQIGDAGANVVNDMDQSGYFKKWNRRRILLGGSAFCLWLSVSYDVHAAETKRFLVDIKGGQVAKAEQTLRVSEGDAVEIEFTSDQAIELHLHGIDIEISVSPGNPAVMAFDAMIAGRFPLEAHGAGAHGSLVYVEVYPR
jgi:hypothetical protein